MKINTILIANRGEIAIRIAKTAKKMGIKTFMFLTIQEPNALYLKYADVIIDVSDDTFMNIFMNINKIVNTAIKYNVDAIHPGYGFLAENPELAKLCINEGIIFIGPSHQVIYEMGNKDVARQIAQKNNIPIVAGSKHIITTENEALEEAKRISFPVIIKAVAGGGGKGMRIVRHSNELSMLYNLAVSEAKAAFGNTDVIIEKYVENPRHIEVQILGDMHGNVIHLFDRECSIQRKHQKLIEEAPSMALNEQLRAKITKDAVKISEAVNYYSAGTVEFLLDANKNHYFMEMNTRIQVEHPITEAITGIDIVEQQILIAQNEILQIKQSDVILRNGCAIEFRINAEDVQCGFSPCTGIIEEMEIPENDNFRFDTGYQTGMAIPSCYDSLIAKLIVFGHDRNFVIQETKKIVASMRISGIKTTLPFIKQVINNESFCDANFNTSFLETELPVTYYQEENEYLSAVALALTAYLNEIETVNSINVEETQINSWILNRTLKNQ